MARPVLIARMKGGGQSWSSGSRRRKLKICKFTNLQIVKCTKLCLTIVMFVNRISLVFTTLIFWLSTLQCSCTQPKLFENTNTPNISRVMGEFHSGETFIYETPTNSNDTNREQQCWHSAILK